MTVPPAVLRQLRVGDEVHVTNGHCQKRVGTISKINQSNFKMKGFGQWFSESDLECNIVSHHSVESVLARSTCSCRPGRIALAKAGVDGTMYPELTEGVDRSQTMAIEKEARGTQNRAAEFKERNKRKENELLHKNLSKCDCFVPC